MAEKITVIDSIMGTGKTSWAIQYMDVHPEQQYIYCTPFLDEVDRIKTNTARDFYDPKRVDGRKIEGFNTLLMEGRDIVLTHSTFSNANAETLEYLSRGNYTLILDEVLDILIDFNDVASGKINKGDIRLLMHEGFITSDGYGRVQWLKDSYPDSKYADVERLAKQGHLFYLDNSLLVWQFPPEIFSHFKKVFVLTYMFSGSFLKPYFEYHKLPYEMAEVVTEETGAYSLIPYNPYSTRKTELKSLISLYDDPQANDYRNSSLSKTWFSNAGKEKLTKLQNRINNYLRNSQKAKSADIMWTCPKDHYNSLKGRGYIATRNPTADERALPPDDLEKLKKQLSCFVPCNSRATNVFRDRSILVYAVNLYCNPYVKRYFSNKNDKDQTNITVDEDHFALSAMLQWIWRSCIRDNKPVRIYIPSTRMRTLLIDWLEGKT